MAYDIRRKTTLKVFENDLKNMKALKKKDKRAGIAEEELLQEIMDIYETAEDFNYGAEVLEQIHNERNLANITRIMITARHKKERLEEAC